MTVKDLIIRLQECNPEAEVITQDGPIYFLEPKPGYYDGHTPKLVQDETKSYYNIVGFEFTPVEKVVIQTMCLRDCLDNCDNDEQIDNFLVKGDTRYLEYVKKLKEEVKAENKLLNINKNE